MNYCEAHNITLEKLLGKIDIVIITATILETEIFHSSLQPIQGYTQIIKLICEKTSYYVGTIGDYTICHAQCSAMGSTQAGSSSVTTLQAIIHWKPKVIFMLGIAFGINKEQNIGDILVAESINGYNFIKANKGEEIPRGTLVQTHDNLLRRIKEVSKDWKYVQKEITQLIHVGEILSGDVLINDLVYRDKLIHQHPKAIGGEMEGIGFYSAAKEKDIPCILIKSICDYADGNKDKDKDANQRLAMSSSVDFITHAFQSNFLHQIFKTNSYKSNLKLIDSVIIENILFNSYDIHKEQYFIERKQDELLKAEVLNKNFWIYGKSGLGKTTSLFRSLKINKVSFKIINLANCYGKSINEVLKIIYSELIMILDIQTPTKPENIDIKAIDRLIKEKTKNVKLYFIIEEIPIDDKKDSFDFVNEMISWVILNYGDDPPYYLYFSSLFNPISHVKDFQSKVYTILKIKEHEEWQINEFKKLVDLINSHLNLTITQKQYDSLCVESKYNPRFVKTFYKNYLTKDSLIDATFQETLNETKRDLYVA